MKSQVVVRRTNAGRGRSALASFVALLLAVILMPQAARAAGPDPSPTPAKSPNPGSTSGASPAAAFTLGIGDELFWDGEEIDLAEVPDPAQCGVTAACYEYELELAPGEPGTRLRVALSAIFQDPEDVRPWPDFLVSAPEMIFRLQLFAPEADLQEDDPVAEGSTGEVFTTYGVELLVGPDPVPVAGTYTVRVIPESVVDMAFRMRAKLEGRPSPVDQTALVEPNLRVIPPFEFNFNTPTATYGPGLGSPHPRASCMAEEIDEAIEEKWDIPQVCLRYSMGVENAGDGRFDVLFDFPRDCHAPAEFNKCEFRQRLWAPDGKTFEDGKPGSAGSGEFHFSHGHFHYQNAWEFQLLEVEEGWRRGDPQPQLDADPRRPGRKLGVQPGNEVMADWHRFYQLDQSAPSSLTTFKLQAGWGDIYEWNRSGNYVDFPQEPAGSGTPKEGFYVLQGITDPQELIIESDETDNVSYAFIEVSKSGKVELLERGYGIHPWDPHKIVLTEAP